MTTEVNQSPAPAVTGNRLGSSALLGSVVRAQSIVGTSKGRNAHDFYPTPTNATQALLRVEKFYGEIWECACGDGAISKVLLEHGYTVRSSDLINRGYGETPVDMPEYDQDDAHRIRYLAKIAL